MVVVVLLCLALFCEDHTEEVTFRPEDFARAIPALTETAEHSKQ